MIMACGFPDIKYTGGLYNNKLIKDGPGNCSEGKGVLVFNDLSSTRAGLPPLEAISWSRVNSVHHIRRFCSRSIDPPDSGIWSRCSPSEYAICMLAPIYKYELTLEHKFSSTMLCVLSGCTYS